MRYIETTTRNIIEADQDFVDSLDGTYEVWDAVTHAEPVSVEPELLVSVTIDKSVVTKDETITVSVEVSADLIIVPVDRTYYIPVLRMSDGKQGKFVKIDLLGGSGTALLDFKEEGVYSVDSDKIVPPLGEGFSISDDIQIIVHGELT